jgi:DNA-binding beta-propeller fold protein YncE
MLADKIFVFNGDTQALVNTFGSRGAGPGQFVQPRALAFDANQLLYVMDSYNDRVQVFDKSGHFVRKFGSKGSPFSGTNTRGLAVDRTHGWVFVVDIGAGTVDKFDLMGTFIQAIGQPSTAAVPTPPGTFAQGGREDTIDGMGHLWVGDMPNFRVQVFDGATGAALFTRPDPMQLPPTGAFNDPRGLTVDSKGNVYVADTHNFRIEKFDSHGVSQWAIGSRGRAQPDTFDYSRNMASDWTDDSIYIADTYNSAIDHYSSDGTLLWRVAGSGTGPGQFAFPSGVGIGAGESVYVADSRNHRIQVLDHSTGAYVSQFDCAPCKDPRGVAVDPATGNIYVSDMNAALLKFDSRGNYVATLAGKGTGAGQLSTASDVVLDSNYIYVADGGADEVKMFSLADGSFITQFRGTGAARMRLPSAIAVDPATGHLYVAEEYNDRVSSWCVTAC